MRPYKTPTTNLEDIVDYRMAVKSEVNLANARWSAGGDKDKLFRGLKRKIDELYEEHRDSLDPNDLYFFHDIDEMEMFLKDIKGLDAETVRDGIRNERAHLEKAKELGYDVKGFTCYMAWYKEQLAFLLGTHVGSTSLIPIDDYKAMCLAPLRPSLTDDYR